MNDFYFGLKRDLRVAKALMKKAKKGKDISPRRRKALEARAEPGRGNSPKEMAAAKKALSKARGGAADDAVYSQNYKIRAKHTDQGPYTGMNQRRKVARRGMGGDRTPGLSHPKASTHDVVWDSAKKEWLPRPHGYKTVSPRAIIGPNSAKEQVKKINKQVGHLDESPRTRAGGSSSDSRKTMERDLTSYQKRKGNLNPDKPFHSGFHTRKGGKGYEKKHEKYEKDRWGEGGAEDRLSKARRARFKKEMDKSFGKSKRRESFPDKGRKWTGLDKALVGGGIAATGGATAYGGYRYMKNREQRKAA